jgi:hypothetical protein
MAEWTGALQARLAQVAPRGDEPVDRLVDVLRRACRNLERQPRLTAAVITALSAPGDDVLTCQREVEATLSAMTASVLDGIPVDVVDGVNAILRHVWYSTLLSWANGRASITQVGDELERAARLLLQTERERVPISPISATTSSRPRKITR